MRAIIYNHYGPPEVLKLIEQPKPTPKENEYLVKVRAVEVTKTDIEFRSFKLAVKWYWLSLRVMLGITKPRKPVLGGYFSGEVVSAGKNATKFNVGDEIYGSCIIRRSAYAEYIALPKDCAVAKKPPEMSFEAAACLVMGGLNGLHFMRRANIKPGEKVLINGAGGCIGTHALQIAKAMGAEVTVVDKGFKEGRLKALGADNFIDFTYHDFREDGKKYDVIFDMPPSSPYLKTLQCLKPNGRYLRGNPKFIDFFRAYFTDFTTDKTVIFAFAPETPEALEELNQLVADKKVQSIVDEVYPMEQVIEAHRRVEQEQRVGAIAMTISQAN